MTVKQLDYWTQFESLKEMIPGQIADIFPIESKTKILKLNKIWVDDNKSYNDFAGQVDAKKHDKTWDVPVYGDFSILDKGTGAVLDHGKKIKLLSIPKATPFGSYIIGGNEYQIDHQLRWEPGAYVIEGDTGIIKAQLNLSKGIDLSKSSFYVHPVKNSILWHIRQKDINVYPVLKGMGMSDEAIGERWGKDFLKSNQASYKEGDDLRALKSLGEAIRTKEPMDTLEQARAVVGTYFQNETALSPETTKITLGKEYSKVSPELIADSTGRLLRTFQGKENPDDRESLMFKELFSLEDHLVERIQRSAPSIKKRLSSVLEAKDKVSSTISPAFFNKPIMSFFTSSALSNIPEQTNPLHMASGFGKVTIHGEGGIENMQSITRAMRNLHPSHMGFLDPIHTPDSDHVGTLMHLPLAVAKDDKKLVAPFYNVRTKKREYLSPKDLYNIPVAVPGQLDDGKFSSKTVQVRLNNSVIEMPAKDVEWAFPDASGVFDLDTNMIPFLDVQHGNRAQFSDMQQPQALSLIHREKPLVQVQGPGGETFEKILGDSFSVKAPEDGEISSVDESKIRLKGKSGTVHTLNIYKDYPLNQASGKSFMDIEVRVKPGDKVKKGQLLGDSNFTKDGVYAAGVNLTTAYMPWKGYNFEDGTVISESAAKKLTSQHIYVKSIPINESLVMKLKDYKVHFVSKYSQEQFGKLDDRGIVTKGTKIKFGDPLFAGLHFDELDPERMELGKLKSFWAGKPKDDSVTWGKDFEGEVLDAVVNPTNIKIYIKTFEPGRVGDKLAGRYGNKQIVTKIIPDTEAPVLPNGDRVDIMMNPAGVISRKNVGQIYETALGKVRTEDNPYVATSFDPRSHLDLVNAELKKHHATDKELLTDPTTGKPIGQVMVGKQHVLKLAKQVDTGYSARYRGEYDVNRRPAKGGATGAKSLDLLTFYAMLAHGSRANIREMSTWKADRNDEFWRMLRTNQPLPAPKTTFVYNKFVSYLKGSGIDVKRKGSKLVLSPLTDEATLSLSGGEIKDATFHRAKDLREEKGGLFDPKATGGHVGEKWSHITLPEPIPNPLFDNAIVKITGLSNVKQLEDLVAGRLAYDPEKGVNPDKGIRGGLAIKTLLDRIDVDKELQLLRDKAKNARRTALNEINKKIRLFENLQKNNLNPTDAYMSTVIPVIPPVFRPVMPLPDGSIASPGINRLYSDLTIMRNQMRDLKEFPDELPDKQKARQALYNASKALIGLGKPINKYYAERMPEGFISMLGSSDTRSQKEGFYQSKVLKKSQDLSARGVITPEPDLGPDEVGLPEPMAWEIYKPFIVKELHGLGMMPLKAEEEVEQKSQLARAALENVMRERPVLLNRAPTLHKFGILGFQPKLSDSKSIQIPPLVVKGFNADFDGDEMLSSIVILTSRERCATFPEGEAFWEERDMTARFKTILPIEQDDKVFMINLQDFPRGELLASKEGEKGKIDFYAVPKGIFVLSHDDKTNTITWKEVAGWSKHYQREIEVVTLSSGRQIVTDDDPRAIYGISPLSWSIGRWTPTAALKEMVLAPRTVRLSNVCDETTAYKPSQYSNVFGYFLGCMAANGWVEHCHNAQTGRIFAAILNKEVGNKFTDSGKKLFDFDGKTLEYHRVQGAGGYGESVKRGFMSKKAAHMTEPLIGSGARDKHLPPSFLKCSKAFRLGLFAGLMDNDGSISVSHGKNKPQLMASYTSASIRLVQEIQWLAASLGIKSRITPTRTPAGEPFWCLNFSIIDIKEWNGKGMVHPEKLAFLHNTDVDATSPIAAVQDVVPISTAFAVFARKTLGASRFAPKDQKSIYVILHKAAGTGYITRQSAKALFTYIPEKTLAQHPHFAQWKQFVDNEDVTWDAVVDVQKTGIREDGYDLTVPGYETFMNIDGVVLSNTMMVHVPISTEAVEEARNMFPSKHLYHPGSAQLLMVPSQEAMVGIYKLSETPEGRKQLNAILPPDLHVKEPLRKASIANIFKTIAATKRDDFPVLINKLKRLGENHATNVGFTVGLSDLETPVIDKVVKAIIKDVQSTPSRTEQDKVKKIFQAGEKIDQAIKMSLDRNNNFFAMVDSGAKGSISDIRQLVATPNMFADYANRPVPEQIKTPFKHGLPFHEYWTSLYGARRGSMDRAKETAVPGEFNKLVSGIAIKNVVSMEDCGTKDGLAMSFEDDDILGRYLAIDTSGVGKRNEKITPDILARANKKGLETLKVRSPLTCQAPQGTCAFCFGDDLETMTPPSVGTNIGAIASQAMGEPMTQMQMRTFHTGGIFDKKHLAGFPEINRIMRMTAVKHGKAALAKQDGTVTAIKPNALGGVDITLDGSVVHAVEPNLEPKVKIGSMVKRGDILSEGIVDPRELLEKKGMEEAQKLMVNEIQRGYTDQGMRIRKRMVETVVRAVANTAEVVRPGDSHFTEGDVISYNVAKDFNKHLEEEMEPDDAVGMKLAKEIEGFNPGTIVDSTIAALFKKKGTKPLIKKDPIDYEPILKGMSMLPVKQKDWLSMMGIRDTKEALRLGTAEGWESDLHAYSPIPSFAYGAEFGKGEKGRY